MTMGCGIAILSVKIRCQTWADMRRVCAEMLPRLTAEKGLLDMH